MTSLSEIYLDASLVEPRKSCAKLKVAGVGTGNISVLTTDTNYAVEGSDSKLNSTEIPEKEVISVTHMRMQETVVSVWGETTIQAARVA